MTTYAEVAGLTRRGNAVGFTASGDVVVGGYDRGWKVWLERDSLGRAVDVSWFGSDRAAATAYAASLIDEAKTRELAWWQA